MRKFNVTVSLKTGEVFNEVMSGNTYENICDQVKEKCFDANNLKSVETEEIFPLEISYKSMPSEDILHPIEVDDASEAIGIVRHLRKHGYFDIQITELTGHDRRNYTAECLAKRFTIADMITRGEGAYLMASEKARAEMCIENGVHHYSYSQVYDYAMEQEFLFDIHGYLKNR